MKLPHRLSIPITLLSLFILATGVSALEEQGTADDDFDEFWEDDSESKALRDGTGTGGGPLMEWMPRQFDGVNEELEAVGLLALPDQELYWGGAAWFGLDSGGPLYVALGGGGFGGGGDAARGDGYSRLTYGAGYFSVKGIYPMHRHLFIESNVQLGGGAASVLVEETADSGIVNVHLRGDRAFVMLRGGLGLDFRLARWIGILVSGGYSLTSGGWNLEGEQALIDRLEFEDQDGAYASVMIRFGL